MDGSASQSKAPQRDWERFKQEELIRRTREQLERRRRQAQNQKPRAEKEEELAAGITGPACPFCSSRNTHATTDGWPQQGKTGDWWCENCGEYGVFDTAGLYWLPEGDPSA